MIDVIIPTYNSSKTLIRTLSSIVIQKNVDDLFVTIVDDCSTEKYDEIIEFYKKYLNIQVIRLEKNSGPGVARQVGIDSTSNPFITFIDSDDEFFDERSLINLRNAIEKFDMAIGLVQYEKAYEKLFFNECVHGKMYRRSFLKDNNITFASYRSHEDNAFNQLCMCICQKIVYVNKIFTIYRYNNNSNSIINTMNYIESMHNNVNCMNWLFEHIEQSEYKNLNTIAAVIVNIIRYLKINYEYDTKLFEFIPKECGFLKEEFNKYIEYYTEKPKELSYRENNYGSVSIEKLEEFLKIVK